jgi:hypothetical protein
VHQPSRHARSAQHCTRSCTPATALDERFGRHIPPGRLHALKTFSNFVVDFTRNCTSVPVASCHAFARQHSADDRTNVERRAQPGQASQR